MENEKKQKPNKKALVALILCAVIVLGAVCVDLIGSRRSCEKNDVAMGTVVSYKLFGIDDDALLERLSTELKGLENSVLSRHSEGSDIYRVNNGAGDFVSVSPDTAQIITQCKEFAEKSDGAFDVSIGRVTKLWDFGGDNQRLPSKDEIQSALKNVGYGNITVSGNAVRIQKGQALDLGAVGKGAACDRVKELLNGSGVDSAIVSVGGSVLLYGSRTFNVGIINPQNDKATMGTLKLKDTCVSTSGDYEKFFEQDGKRYHHILNATTGYPATSEFQSVTVVCESGLLSDALSTVCYIAGYRKSIEILDEYDAEAVFIFKNNAVKVTPGLEKSFELTDDSYTVDE